MRASNWRVDAVRRKGVLQRNDGAGVERAFDRRRQTATRTASGIADRRQVRADDAVRRQERSRRAAPRNRGTSRRGGCGRRRPGSRSGARVGGSPPCASASLASRSWTVRSTTRAPRAARQRADLGFDELPVRDVLGEADDAVDRAVVVAQRERAVADPALAAVRADDRGTPRRTSPRTASSARRGSRGRGRRDGSPPASCAD